MKAVQFLGLSLLLFLCGATEYYVRPTEPTDTSCPAQPCLTLSQYISDSDLYFKSNTVFKFLPGLHRANQTLDMWSVENVSLEGEKNSDPPVVMMDIRSLRYDCAAACFRNISNLIIHSLNFSIRVESFSMHRNKSSVCGFMFSEVSLLQMYNTSVKFAASDFLNTFSITVYESKYVFLHSLTIVCDNKYCTVINIEDSDDILVLNVSVTFGAIGLAVMGCRNINISDTEVMCTSLSGMFLYSNIATNISNVAVKLSRKHGIYVKSNHYTNICNTLVMFTQESGILVEKSFNTHIANTSVSYSGIVGLYFHSVHHVMVTNTSVNESFNDGIDVFSSTNVTFLEMSLKYISSKNVIGEAQIDKKCTYSGNDSNYCLGLLLEDVNSVFMYSVGVIHFNVGIATYSCINITIKNTSVTQVGGGINSFNSSNVHISGIILDILNFGIRILQSEYFVTAEVTIVLSQLQKYPVRFSNCKNVQIISILLVPMGAYEVLSAISIEHSNGVAISKSVFANFGNLYRRWEEPAVVTLFESSNISFSDCSFERNNVTALRVICSHFTVLGVLQFTGNRANIGGAIIFEFGSTMKVSQNGSVYFVDNYAALHGGAIYLTSSGDSYVCVDVPHPDCFLQRENCDFDERLTFVNNSAEKGGDVMYGRVLGFTQNSIIQHNACVILFNDTSRISPDTMSTVASDPVRVCICSSGIPKCVMLSMAVDPIFPGQSFIVSAVVIGAEGGTVAGSVFANFLQLHSIGPQLAAGEGTKIVTQHHCNQLEYTTFSRNTYEVLALSAFNNIGKSDPMPLTSLQISMFINITLLPCPPGFTLQETSGKCDCSRFVLQLPGVTCNIKDQTIHRSGLVWVGSLKNHNQTVKNVITSKYCPLNYCKREGISVDLNQPDTQCEFNHSGILCGGCQPGLSLMLGGGRCEVCSNKNLALIIPFLLTGVVLVFFLKISNITTSKGFINSLVFYASIVKANEHIFLPRANTNPLTLFISWLNLDLGVQTCFFNGLSAYTKTWLHFVFPFYIWGITGVIIFSARYSIRIARISGNNSVPVLATLFLLSYAKLLGIIITSLSYTVLEYPGGQKVVWSADGNIDYFGPKHAPLFVAAVATLLFLWLPYTVLLFTGQWLYKCKLSLINHLLIKLKPFLDAHYGPLKDNHRYWFGALLLVRTIILLISTLVTKDNFSILLFLISIATIILIITSMAFSHIGIDLRAYRSKAVSLFEYSIFINLVVLCLAKYHTSVGGGSEIVAFYTLIGIVFVQFIGLLLFKVYSVVKNAVFLYVPLNDSKEEEGVWRYENSIEMQTTQYRNVSNVL